MIVPDGSIVKSSMRRYRWRKVVEIRQLGNAASVWFRDHYQKDGPWTGTRRSTLSDWEKWCEKHNVRVIRP